MHGILAAHAAAFVAQLCRTVLLCAAWHSVDVPLSFCRRWANPPPRVAQFALQATPLLSIPMSEALSPSE